MSQLHGPFTKVYATNDGIAPPDRVMASKTLLPEHTEWVEIKGGNHSQFGHYGHQLFDGKATISGEAQQASTREVLLDDNRFALRRVVHGSGAEGRSGQNRFLADQFARRGVAAFSFDKRGVGASTGDWQRSTFDDLAGDVLAGMAMLGTRLEIDPDRIGLFGSSEGAGYVAPLAASRRRVAFLVLKSGPFVSPPEQYLFEDSNALRAQGFDSVAVSEALSFRRPIFETAQTRDWSRLDAEVRRVQTARWFDYMRPGPRDFWLRFTRSLRSPEPGPGSQRGIQRRPWIGP